MWLGMAATLLGAFGAVLLFLFGGLLALSSLVGFLASRRWKDVPFPGLVIVLWVIVLGFHVEMLRSHDKRMSREAQRMCKGNLHQIGNAMVSYMDDHDGDFPFDSRGPLGSLALLYPRYVDTPLVFKCPEASRKRKKRETAGRFPEDTVLAGLPCYFGYTWRVPNNTPGDFAIAADMPENHSEGFNVLYASGEVRWAASPFCSHDPADNIFAREPGWSADTDSFIRQE